MRYRYAHNIRNHKGFNQTHSDREIAEKRFLELLLENKAITESITLNAITLNTFILSPKTVSRILTELEFLRTKVSDKNSEIVNNIIDMFHEN